MPGVFPYKKIRSRWKQQWKASTPYRAGTPVPSGNGQLNPNRRAKSLLVVIRSKASQVSYTPNPGLDNYVAMDIFN